MTFDALIPLLRIFDEAKEFYEQPWGRGMTVTDPFGNRITFCDARET